MMFWATLLLGVSLIVVLLVLFAWALCVAAARGDGHDD